MSQAEQIDDAILSEERQAEEPVSETAPHLTPEFIGSAADRARFWMAQAHTEAAYSLSQEPGSPAAIEAWAKFVRYAKRSFLAGREAGYQ
jgi:hypothetical protein